MAVTSAIDAGPRAVLLNVAENTTLHGVPNAYRAHSWIRKIIWSILCLASFGMCLYQVSSNFLKYYDYPTSSTSGVVAGRRLEFPAVTFCNMNPVRKSQMNETVMREISPENNRSVNYLIFQLWYAPLSTDEKNSMGYSLDHMLLSCEFAGDNCTDSNYFTPFLNGLYGNCYTFTGGTASSVGPTGGLVLELYIGQNEYLPILSDVAGIKLLIHNESYMPLPEKEGVVLSPGFASDIAIVRSETRRAKPKYGDCAEVSAELNKDLNVYAHFYDYINYTYQACRFTCYQQNVIENCDCGDAAYPLSGGPLPFKIGEEARPCASVVDQKCITEQKRIFSDGDGNCTAACPVMCLEIFYEQTLSFGLWPSKLSEDKIFDKIKMRLGEDGLDDALSGIDSDAEEVAWVRNNVVKVTVYFERLEYNTITTGGSYSVINLLSDQGGQVGLWLGLSVLTLFEMVELLWDLLASVVLGGKGKPAPTNTDSKPPENISM